MTFKQILLVLNGSGSTSDAATACAAAICRREGATVEGLCIFREPFLAIADGYAVGPRVPGAAPPPRDAKVHDLTATAAAWFQSRIGCHALSDGWNICEVDASEEVLDERSHLVDLVILAPVDGDREFRGVVERFLLRRGAPRLLAPDSPSGVAPFARVVLAWNGSREAERAMRDGMHFLKGANAVAVVVAEEAFASAVDDRETRRLLKHLARHGVEAELVRTTGGGASAGRTLLDQCAAYRADLLIMGAYGRPRAAEIILGGATRTVVSEARLPVLMSH